jgi:hypothetical protein
MEIPQLARGSQYRVASLLGRDAKFISDAITRAHSARLLELNISVGLATKVLQPVIPPRLSNNRVAHRSSGCEATRDRCI